MTESPHYVKYPVMQVRPYGLLVYDRLERLTPFPKRKHLSGFNRPGNRSDEHGGLRSAYTGVITPYAKRKLKRAIQLMVASAETKEAPNWKTGGTFKFKVNFITLTLPAPQREVTDKDIKKHCLDNFIKRLKRKYKLNSYVWRAERQKNGNLHFHIITDTWIHYEKIRNDWNGCLAQYHFIDEFENKHGHRNPNSTDVHAVWKVKNLTQYFVKYMSKGADTAEDLYNIPFQRKKWHEKLLVKPGTTYKRVMTRAENRIDGKLWDCSVNLKVKQNCEVQLEGDQYNLWEKVYNDPQVEIKTDQNFSIAFLKPHQFNRYITGDLRKRWEAYLHFIRCAEWPPGHEN
jgi:hypothetical protein